MVNARLRSEQCLGWWIQFWPTWYGSGEWRKNRVDHWARRLSWTKVQRQNHRLYSGNTKWTKLAGIYDMYKEVVRISLKSLYILWRDEWQVEESSLNLVDKGILQKFPNNRFMWSKLEDDSLGRMGQRGESTEVRGPQLWYLWLDYNKAGCFCLNLNWCPWVLVFSSPYTYIHMLHWRLLSEKWSVEWEMVSLYSWAVS